jgi:transcription elongation factor Elf1
MTQQTAVTTKKYDSVFECPRCSGQGYIQAFSHIKSGVCFLCGGAKVIEIKKKYPKSDKLVCRFTKGHCNMYDANWKLEWVYREAIGVSFDGGYEYSFATLITAENKESMRSLWLWCKQNGAEMLVEDEDARSPNDE